VCCSAECCSVLQCVAVCCIVRKPPVKLARIARIMISLSTQVLAAVCCMCCSTLHLSRRCSLCAHATRIKCTVTSPQLSSVLQCVAVCCGVLQCVAVCCSVLQCVAVCCSVLQYVEVCCSTLHLSRRCSLCAHATRMECTMTSPSTQVCVAVCCSLLQYVAPFLTLLYTCTRNTGTMIRSSSQKYGVAMVIRIDKIIGLFCRISSLL